MDNSQHKRQRLRKRNIDMVAWNFQRILTKYEDILQEVVKYNVDIAAFLAKMKIITKAEDKPIYLHFCTTYPRIND